jgi:class 3 adenylate cyclase
MEGSLNKIIAYNEGFTVVACWGVSPYSHDDDAARAVIAGQNIKKKIERLAKGLGDGQTQIPLHIGISTGSVYMGIIGNDGGRKEVIILGQAIERAFLFM